MLGIGTEYRREKKKEKQFLYIFSEYQKKNGKIVDDVFFFFLMVTIFSRIYEISAKKNLCILYSALS